MTHDKHMIGCLVHGHTCTLKVLIRRRSTIGKKNGNLAENDLVLHAWFDQQKVLSHAYDRVLGEWARQHAGCGDPPPK